MMTLYDEVCAKCSKEVTTSYSTSFSLGIKVFNEKFREPIYNIYGFVRFADEIVDTFHDKDKEMLLNDFESNTYIAIKTQISLNPILHSFQRTVNEYNIDHDLIAAFIHSMRMDLTNSTYGLKEYKEYIYGSAEVVGLMCLKVFCKESPEQYELLKEYAKSLGSAFQKINFLRDIKSDYEERGRTYFPEVDYTLFDNNQKSIIENDIELDFNNALIGIKKLPKGCRLGVYLAFIYYKNLFFKIAACNAETIANQRIRVRNRRKIYLLATSAIKNQLNLI